MRSDHLSKHKKTHENKARKASVKRLPQDMENVDVKNIAAIKEDPEAKESSSSFSETETDAENDPMAVERTIFSGSGANAAILSGVMPSPTCSTFSNSPPFTSTPISFDRPIFPTNNGTSSTSTQSNQMFYQNVANKQSGNDLFASPATAETAGLYQQPKAADFSEQTQATANHYSSTPYFNNNGEHKLNFSSWLPGTATASDVGQFSSPINSNFAQVYHLNY